MKHGGNFLKNVPLGWAITFYACLTVDILLLVISFILPPEGQIHPSVLQAAAELMVFPTLYTLYECISKGLAAKYTFNLGGMQLGLETTGKEENKDE